MARTDPQKSHFSLLSLLSPGALPTGSHRRPVPAPLCHQDPPSLFHSAWRTREGHRWGANGCCPSLRGSRLNHTFDASVVRWHCQPASCNLSPLEACEHPPPPTQAVFPPVLLGNLIDRQASILPDSGAARVASSILITHPVRRCLRVNLCINLSLAA